MRLPNILLLIALIIAASLANAQQFKVLKDTVDYKLMEVDSGYYYSHGLDSKCDFVRDSNKIKNVRITLYIPLRDDKSFDMMNLQKYENEVPIKGYYYEGENKNVGYYVVSDGKYCDIYRIIMVEKDGKNDSSDIRGYYSCSPFSKSNGYYFFPQVHDSLSIFNLTTRNLMTINIPNFRDFWEDKIKWINENTFLCMIDTYILGSLNDYENKYFLIEIKK